MGGGDRGVGAVCSDTCKRGRNLRLRATVIELPFGIFYVKL